MEECFVRVIEGEKTTPIIHELDSWDILLDRTVGSRRIVDHCGFNIVVLNSF